MSTILLTGAGGAAIPDLIKHLKSLGYRVLTSDMNPHAPGLFLGDGGFLVPPGTQPKWLTVVKEICQDEAIDVVIPLVDEELMEASFLPMSGIPAVLPKRHFVEICLDKWVLMQALQKHGIPRPISSLFDGLMEPFCPTIVKPRRGRGSRGIHRYAHHGELFTALVKKEVAYSDCLIAQEFIEGPEYTVSVVCDHHNNVHAVVPKEIILKQGATRLAVTRRNEVIDSVCREIAAKLNPCGPFNVQLRMREGVPYVFEINPRFSGTVNLTIAAGCDEVGGLIELALGRPYTFGAWKEGVVLVRQTHDMVMDESEFRGKTPRRWDV